MSSLEHKIETISLKVKTLLEQNAQYRELVGELEQQIKRLENENQTLKSATADAAPSSLGSPNNKEELIQQIDKYIQDIDLGIQWLSDFE